MLHQKSMGEVFSRSGGSIIYDPTHLHEITIVVKNIFLKQAHVQFSVSSWLANGPE